MPYHVSIYKIDRSVSRYTQRLRPDLMELRAGVEGPIEIIPYLTNIAGVEGIAYFSQERHMRNLPLNIKASLLWIENLGDRAFFSYRPLVLGNMMFVARVEVKAKVDKEDVVEAA